jgi:hypothetical protein
MMRQNHHSHSKPSAGKSILLAAVWQSTLQLPLTSTKHLTGGHGSRFSDCYLFLLKPGEFVGGDDEQYFSDRHRGQRRLLQVTA